jgi:hypothetical protein
LNIKFSKSTLGLDKSEQKFYNQAAAKVVGILIYPAKVFGFMPSSDPILEEKRGSGRGDPGGRPKNPLLGKLIVPHL